MIKLKTDDEIKLMYESNRIVANVLRKVKKIVESGITTKEIDTFIESEILKNGAKPSFKGYQGYPAAACISINEEVVHGIPGNRIVCDGDIVSIDVGALKNKFHGDSAITVAVGNITEEEKKLLRVTKESLMEGISKAYPGNRLGDISSAIQTKIEENEFSVVRSMVGHGIGRDLHEEPEVPNFGKPGRGIILKPGLVIAIEPMVNIGTHKIKTLSDGWTIVTADGKKCAHFEHTIAITEDGPRILSTIL